MHFASFAPFTIEELMVKCPPVLESGRKPEASTLSKYLDTMCADPVVKMASALNGKYMLNLQEMGNALKQILLENVMKYKFGDLSCRLYRLMLRKHANGECTDRGMLKFEVKQLADMAVLPEKEARPLLMRMLQAEYVLLQELPRTNDHNPRTTMYLWYVEPDRAYRTLERETLRTMYNLQSRISAERAKHAQVLRTADPMGSAASLEELPESEEAQALYLAQRRIDYLTHAMLKVHETLMMLRTF